MGRVLGVLVWIITLASVLLFTHGRWWFPPSISEHGPAYDRQFMLTIIVVGVSFVAAQIALGWAVWRYRATSNADRAVYSHGNNRLEMIWTVITAIIFISLAVKGQSVWADLHFRPAPAGAAQVRVTAQQFQWNFHYPGADGKFGRTDPTLINDSSLNFIGLDDADAASKDDSVVGSLIVQVNRPVNVMLRSRDVTHSLWVPQLRFKQDAVPGLDIPVHFTPNKVGRYEIACAELCGQLHYKMKSYLIVLPEQEFRELMAMQQSQFQKRVTELFTKPEYQVPSF
jgi:cytochrome c oxidase subunit 2